MINKNMSDIPYNEKESKFNPYIESFDVQESKSIDFETLNTYKNSEYVVNKRNIQNLANDINTMQSHWSDDVIGDLYNKKVLFDSWIINYVFDKGVTYNFNKLYFKNNIVSYYNNLYICTSDYNKPNYQQPPIGVIANPNIIGVENVINIQIQLSSDAETVEENFVVNYGQSSSSTSGEISVDYNGKNDIHVTIPYYGGEYSVICLINQNAYKAHFFNVDYSLQDVGSVDWLLLPIRGDAGQYTFKLNYRGEWEANESYANETTTGADVVWFEIGRNIDFYVCSNPVQSSTTPDQDTEHWLLLFSKARDAFVIYDSMPNQSFFENETSPSVFGVIDDSYGVNLCKIIDRLHTLDMNDPVYLYLQGTGDIVYHPTSSTMSTLNSVINDLISRNNI